jgi:hypothetical protein
MFVPCHADPRGAEMRLHDPADGGLLDDGGAAPTHHLHDPDGSAATPWHHVYGGGGHQLSQLHQLHVPRQRTRSLMTSRS